jgi:EAL domain-containing protein (putative c-di-GMP-specific phosphodiesterase class I)
MLAVIENSFANKTFNVMLQPMCDARTRQIYGAELLLRITDGYTNTPLRPDELVNVAAKYDKIGTISNALLDLITTIYKQYGATVFNPLKFQRLSLNTDYSLFTDENFTSDVKAYIDDAKLPRNFLAFEIPESDVANHLHEFSNISRVLRELHIVLVCDQYTGRFASLEALKEVGFNEVKISRNVINHIDSERQRLNDVKTLLNNIKALGLKASVVGVENIDQYLLLKDIDETVLMQGFYLHHPLDRQALIEAVRGANRSNANKED